LAELLIDDKTIMSSKRKTKSSSGDDVDDAVPIIAQEQKALTVDEMLLNLKILAELKEYDKVITQQTIEIDNGGLFQGVRRWFSDESREKTVKRIGELFDGIFEFIDKTIREEKSRKGRRRELFDQDTSQLLQRFLVDIKNAIVGIENLRLTYRNDITVRSKLTLLIDKLKIKTDRLNEVLRIDLRLADPSPSQRS